LTEPGGTQLGAIQIRAGTKPLKLRLPLLVRALPNSAAQRLVLLETLGRI
jgi:hypothetical protein